MVCALPSFTPLPRLERHIIEVVGRPATATCPPVSGRPLGSTRAIPLRPLPDRLPLAFGGLLAPVDQRELRGDDVVGGPLDPLVIGVFPGLDAPLDVDLRSLAQMLARRLRQPLPGDDPVPLRLVRPLAIGVLTTPTGGEREIG